MAAGLYLELLIASSLSGEIGSALAPNLGSLIAFRFLAGIFGSGCLTLGGGIIADMFVPRERGQPMPSTLWGLSSVRWLVLLWEALSHSVQAGDGSFGSSCVRAWS